MKLGWIEHEGGGYRLTAVGGKPLVATKPLYGWGPRQWDKTNARWSDWAFATTVNHVGARREHLTVRCGHGRISTVARAGVTRIPFGTASAA